jgi:hypothetical protein
LLGLIEGEGSFHLWRNDLAPAFGIVLSEKQLPLLENVKEYLINNLGFDSYSIVKLKASSGISLNHQKARGNSKPSVLLLIAKNIHILHNYFIPFFNDMRFRTKKHMDFMDFKVICRAVYIGAHKIPEIKDLILKLSLTMNNYRLSTNNNKVDGLNQLERDKLSNVSATQEHLSDGRIIDILTEKIISQHSSCVYEIVHISNGKDSAAKDIVQTLTDAAQKRGRKHKNTK